MYTQEKSFKKLFSCVDIFLFLLYSIKKKEKEQRAHSVVPIFYALITQA